MTKSNAIGRLLAQAALGALVLVGPGADAASAQAGEPAGAVGLMYHRFGEEAYPSTNVRLDQFDRHLEAIAAGGATVVTLGEVVDAFEGNATLPARAVAISVDDAYASVLAEAWPRLRAAGHRFTLFVATDPVDKGISGYLDWDGIRALAADGVEIGSQAVTHPSLPGLDAAALKAELTASADRIEAETGTRPDLFAYPYGEASAAVMRAARAAGYRAAFGQHSGVMTAGQPRFYLPRFPINETFATPNAMRQRLDARPMPVSDITPADPTVRPGANPPAFGFTLTAALPGLDRLACYRSGVGEVTALERLGPRVELRFDAPFPPGRTRVNCTAPTADGAWRWFGWQFHVPG